MGWFSSILLQVKGWFGMIENVVDEIEETVEDVLEVAEDVVNVLEDSLEDLAAEEVEDK
jgi:hypothetical protein